jgi:hypothetical protein
MEEFKAAFESINNVPPPMLLAFVLSFVRLIFVKALPHNLLNGLALIAGAVVMPLVSVKGKIDYDVHSPVTFTVLQGISAGAISIVLSGLIKVWMKKKNIDLNDTEIITKEEINEKTPAPVHPGNP